MLKKVAFCVLAMAVVLGSVGIASAAQNVANTSQKGSLLIYPLVLLQYNEPEGGFDTMETYISIANDNYLEVWVKCYWMDAEQEIQDFVFRLTPNQPVWFKASDGLGSNSMTVPPFMGLAGELKCWAVSDASAQYQLAFNHLYGSAFVVQGNYTGFEYNAWSFTARPGAGGPGVATYLGDKGFLPLTGLTGGYDACPQYLVENFIAYQDNEAAPGDGSEFEPTLVLSPCKQDVRQDRMPTCTKAKFDVWNENETKYTGAHRCIKCWYEGELGEIDYGTPKAGAPYATQGFGYGKDKFSFKGLHTFMGRFRVTGQASSVCNKKFLRPDGTDVCVPPGQVDSPLLGVLWHEIQFAPGLASFNVGNTPHGAGADGTGWIKWDWQGDSPEAPAVR
jgi:hypothetical protein